jgi:hypothetical protein
VDGGVAANSWSIPTNPVGSREGKAQAKGKRSASIGKECACPLVRHLSVSQCMHSGRKRHGNYSLAHSSRSNRAGSTLSACRAGIQVATSQISAMVETTPANASGSREVAW